MHVRGHSMGFTAGVGMAEEAVSTQGSRRFERGLVVEMVAVG